MFFLKSRNGIKRYLGVATLVGMVMTAIVTCAYADLYVISASSNSVLRYNEVTGAFIGKFVSGATGGLSNPNGLLFGRDGNLYVTSPGTHSVMRYDGTTGTPLPAPGQRGATFITTSLVHADQLILGPDGNLYVAGFDRSDNSVLRYDGTTGAYMDAFIPPGSGGLREPGGLLFGPDGNLYITSTGTGQVMRYDGTTGAPLPAPGQRGAVFASHPGLGGIPGLVFGPDGNLYVSDFGNSSVVRFNGTTGEFMDTFVPPGSGGLNAAGPMLLFGPDNNLYVGSEKNSSVLRYDGMTGAFIDVFIRSGSGGLNLAHGQFFTNTDPTTLAYVPPPPNRFLITAPATAVSGTPFDVTVTALDRAGNIANYIGSVTFASSDPHATLPANYTFVAADKGRHTFAGVMLFTAGPQTLTAQDTGNGSLTGSATVGGTAAPADHFLIAAPQATVSGMPFDVTVTALDPYGNIGTGYTGTVTIASSDVQATLPGNYTFTADDNGAHTFAGVTLFTSGAQTLTAQDTANGSLTGSATVAGVAAAADHFQITAPATAASGTSFDVTLTALDPYGNVDTNYTGTITWTSSDGDPGAILPADYRFQSTNSGTHTFPGGVTLVTPGNQTLTATDSASGIPGSATVTVVPRPQPPPGGGARKPRIPGLNADTTPARRVQAPH